MREIACRTCGGAGKAGPVHLHRADGNHQWIDEMACCDCGGTGQWSADRLAAWEAGQKARRERLDRGESLREAATRLGIKPSELSRFEQGRAALKEGVSDNGNG